MFFWKKDTAKEIRDDLKKIRNKVGRLESFTKQIEQTGAIIQSIKSKIDRVEHEILQRATEEKAKPWIDARFDPQIDQLAQQEIQELNKLKQNLGSYAEETQQLKTAQDLNALIDLLEQEETTIQTRDEQILKQIETWERETIRERLSRPSDEAPSLRTVDGVPWKNIVTVARQLGGWFKRIKGEHEGKILFPGAGRPTLVSADIGATRIAKQFREQLVYSMPGHKIPNAKKLRDALTAGDIYLAA
ncbi:hypothetical protein J4457_00265 [Candidatus Woesearchaeota archaeon]|nr:hypothetical protein [Candidatus Woesearchaeota archaeon]